MKKWWKSLPLAAAVLAACAAWGVSDARAETTDDNVIAEGLSIAGIDVSGMTASQAEEALSDYAEEFPDLVVSLEADGESILTTAGEIGLSADVSASVEEALSYGKTGNLVARYKQLKDLEQESKDLPLAVEVDEDTLTAYLEENAEQLNRDAVDYGLTRENGEFVVTGGTNGIEIDLEASAETVEEFFLAGWTEDNTSVELAYIITEPQGSEEELSQVQDLLGTYSTSYSSSASGRKVNVKNGCDLISGTVLYPGETFSVYDAVSPFTAENGYELAGSYENGTTVETYGGGICQVSTTLYNAVIRAELEIVERYGHSLTVSYVDPSADAAIAGTYKDLKFTNNTDYPIYISGYADGSTITFSIYGVETRAENRTIEFVSETTSTTEATVEYVADSSSAIGTMTKTQSSHTGKTARLWKIVYIDGVEESREVFNTTTYSMSPTIYSVGVASSSSEATAAMKAAIATQDSATIQAAMSKWNASALAAAEEEEEEEEDTTETADTSDTSESSSSSETSDTSEDVSEDTSSTESTTTEAAADTGSD